MRNREEAQLSAALMQYLESVKPNCVYCSIPNGSRRGIIEAANLKRQGMIAGAADWVFTWDHGSGWIELKTKKGRMTDSQTAFKNSCEKQGVSYQVCSSLEDCIQILTWWGLIPRRKQKGER